MLSEKLFSNKNNIIEGLFILKPKLYSDKRGYFFESWNKTVFDEIVSEDIFFVQDNHSLSNLGVLRGLHFQSEKYSQSKLISVFDGKILDVVVDLRKTSKTYLKHFKIVLSSKLKNSLFIPKGFAHGYLTMSENAIVHYKVDEYYNKKNEMIIAFDDNKFNIDWGIEKKKIILSQKDINA